GLRIRCELDRRKYPKGKKVTDAEMAALNMRQDKFHGDWNYKFLPRAQD
ncbi:MAG: ISAzo13 family transposase, partial [Planctomycetes bacterium]|nr:ISAzo13 family transposase [Planctomycetota bacterium]